MKDDRLQHLKGKNVHVPQRPPQAPMPHMCGEILTGRRSNGGTRASRSLRNLSINGNSKKNVDLSEGIG